MGSLVERIDASILRAIAPTAPSNRAAAQAALIKNLGAMLPELLTVADATTSLRISHFLAQIAHESDGFCAIEEYASGAAYEGRIDLGNTHAGDGKRFKGRGPIQLTGRGNYGAFTRWMRKRIPDCPDFEQQPELVAMWPWAGWAAAYFWAERPALNLAADRDDLVAVTKIVNGGKNGLPSRAAYLALVKAQVVKLQGNLMSAEQQFATVHRGMLGDQIEQIQRQLRAADFYFLSIDGNFGGGTEAAVKAFQKAHNLVPDGIVGRLTAEALGLYTPAGA